MFQELLRYSTSSISQNGQCSSQFNTSAMSFQSNLAFWSGNAYNCVCLAEFPNNLLTPKKALGFAGPTNRILLSELHQASSVCVVHTFGYDELYNVLAGPCVEIQDRYDPQSVLQFLLIKLRTATDSAWLDNLPELRQVTQASTT